VLSTLGVGQPQADNRTEGRHKSSLGSCTNKRIPQLETSQPPRDRREYLWERLGHARKGLNLMTLTDLNPFGASTPPPPAAARAVGLVKIYGKDDTAVRALDDVDVEFRRGRFTAVMGPSGSGKSTLMHCMAGLDTPTSGEVFVGDDQIAGLDDKGLTRLRRDRIGFVFQSFNLVPTLTAGENITLPASLAGRKVDRAWFDYLVDRLAIRDRLSHRPTELSGGQQQRVACARALVSRPDLIFADEPTGNLDSNASETMLAFLRQSVDEFGQTIVMVTHDARGAAQSDRVIFLSDGKVVGQLESPTADLVLEKMKGLRS
jgi:putative ABC transport system ATP-binding protein